MIKPDYEHLTQTYQTELKSYRAQILQRITLQDFKQLQKQNWIHFGLALIQDWAFIFVSVWLTAEKSILFLPLTLLILGSKQRALSNLIHEASHGNLLPLLKWNDTLTNLFAGYPMADSVQSYRSTHGDHHRLLGSSADPDTLTHLQYGYHHLVLASPRPIQLYWMLFWNRASWMDSCGAGFLSLCFKDQFRVLIWWLSFFATLSFVISFHFAWSFILIWIASRATVFHGVRIFAEFLDHSGLSLGSISSFSRNLPHRGLLSWYFHPHCDTYHLAHHLFPNIPHYHLSKIDLILLNIETYRKAHHCDSYFYGAHPATLCWVKKCCHEIDFRGNN
jgi:fatty acid desaturase